MEVYNTSPADDALIALGRAAIQMTPYISLIEGKGTGPGMTGCMWCKMPSHSTDRDPNRHMDGCVWVRAHLALQDEARKAQNALIGEINDAD